jgi:hypothetical protein
MSKITPDDVFNLVNDILYTEKYKYIVSKRVSLYREDYVIYSLKLSKCRLHCEFNSNDFYFIANYEDAPNHTDVCTLFEVDNNQLAWTNPLFETLEEAQAYQILKEKEKLIKNVIE